MKRIFGKNKLAILALAVMIGVAGYMSFADGEKGSEKKDAAKVSAKADEKDDKQVEVISYDEIELNGPEETIGDAVLTSTGVTELVAQARLTREQSRSKSREALMDIISDEALSEDAKKEATDTYVKLNDTIEKETDVETLLAARGYENAIVTISDSSVDVALGADSITDEERAQIEDIVTRKTGHNISELAISMAEDK